MMIMCDSVTVMYNDGSLINLVCKFEVDVYLNIRLELLPVI